jgi:hypothetical protein
LSQPILLADRCSQGFFFHKANASGLRSERIEAWQVAKFFYNARVISLLRFIGLLNAAVWLGAAVSFTIALGPAFFSEEMKIIIPPPYNGAAAQIVIKRYFILLHICGGIALLHFFWEKLYTGKIIARFTLLVLLAVIALGLFGGFWLQPKLRNVLLTKYNAHFSVEVRKGAEQSFKVWHGVSQTMNLFVIGGLLIYLWHVSNPPYNSRFVSANKFKGCQ